MNARKLQLHDVVRVASLAEQGSSRAHFRHDEEAVIVEISRGHGETGLLFLSDGNKSWWYPQCFLAFIRKLEPGEFEKIAADKEAREARESDLDWIIDNWKTIREKVPGATICELMNRIGITNPWGAHGEGFIYYGNAQAAYKYFDPILCMEDKGNIRKFFAELEAISNKLP